ncbi:MAG: PH domain-containing protein [Lachnospiraceae bacterium]|nr:PH domain-containing protein [Lachnospiraceae bacterium]
MTKSEKNNYLWYDRKRTFLGLPLSFTKYGLSEDRFFVEKGFFTTTFDEVRLYRILDLKLTQTLGQKMFGVGSIKVYSSDRAQGEFEILNIKKPRQVKELLSSTIEKQRDAKRVYNREMLGGHDSDTCGGPDFHDNDFDDDIDGVEDTNN